jgi:hypothetical protein
VHGRDRGGAARAPHDPPVVRHQPEVAPEHCLRGGRAETDQHLRLDRHDFRLEPGQAGVDLHRAGLLVDPPLATLLELEVFDDVGDVGLVPSDTGLLEGPVEHLAGGSDERPAQEILLIAGLLADEQERRAARALPEDSLRGVLVEVAALAGSRGGPEGGQAPVVGHEPRRGGGLRGRGPEQIEHEGRGHASWVPPLHPNPRQRGRGSVLFPLPVRGEGRVRGTLGLLSSPRRSRTAPAAELRRPSGSCR